MSNLAKKVQEERRRRGLSRLQVGRPFITPDKNDPHSWKFFDNYYEVLIGDGFEYYSRWDEENYRSESSLDFKRSKDGWKPAVCMGVLVLTQEEVFDAIIDVSGMKAQYLLDTASEGPNTLDITMAELRNGTSLSVPIFKPSSKAELSEKYADIIEERIAKVDEVVEAIYDGKAESSYDG